MATTLINRVVLQLKSAYEAKNWSTQIRHNHREDYGAETAILLFMPGFMNMFSHSYSFFIEANVLKKIRIYGDYNAVVKEANAVEKSQFIFSLPIKKIDFSHSAHTEAKADIYLDDYSHLI